MHYGGVGVTPINWNYISSLIDENKIDDIVIICRRMNAENYNSIKNKLIDELKTTNNIMRRNTISIVLSDLGCDEIIPIIISIIKNLGCENIGTLIYCLEQLNCENQLENIIGVLFCDNLEAKCNMYNLLIEKFPNIEKDSIDKYVAIMEKEREKMISNLEIIDELLDNLKC